MSKNLEILKAYRAGERVLMSVHDREDGTLYGTLSTNTHWSREIELDEETIWEWWELSHNVPKPTGDYAQDYVKVVVDMLAECTPDDYLACACECYEDFESPEDTCTCDCVCI